MLTLENRSCWRWGVFVVWSRCGLSSWRWEEKEYTTDLNTTPSVKSSIWDSCTGREHWPGSSWYWSILIRPGKQKGIPAIWPRQPHDKLANLNLPFALRDVRRSASDSKLVSNVGGGAKPGDSCWQVMAQSKQNFHIFFKLPAPLLHKWSTIQLYRSSLREECPTVTTDRRSMFSS